jgi:hypothetical protein
VLSVRVAQALESRLFVRILLGVIMAESTIPPTLPHVRPPRTVQQKTNDNLREAFYRVNHLSSALLLWDRFTDEERQSLYVAAGAALASIPAVADPENVNDYQFSACFRHFRGSVGMWMHLHAVSQPRAVIQLARELNMMNDIDYSWLDRELSKTDPVPPAPEPNVTQPHCDNSDDDEDLDEKIDRARHEHDLVVVQGNGVRQIYWKQQLVAWGRHPVLWELLWQLVERATLGQEVRWDMLSNRKDEKTITRRRWRLKHLLPCDLDGAIKRGQGVGSYKLQLDPHQIALFELSGDEWLMEAE